MFEQVQAQLLDGRIGPPREVIFGDIEGLVTMSIPDPDLLAPSHSGFVNPLAFFIKGEKRVREVTREGKKPPVVTFKDYPDYIGVIDNYQHFLAKGEFRFTGKTNTGLFVSGVVVETQAGDAVSGQGTFNIFRSLGELPEVVITGTFQYPLSGAELSQDSNQQAAPRKPRR